MVTVIVLYTRQVSTFMSSLKALVMGISSYSSSFHQVASTYEEPGSKCGVTARKADNVTSSCKLSAWPVGHVTVSACDSSW